MRIRICKDCGREFIGAPKAGRCADCARIARNETAKRYKHNKNRKSVGSEGICEICGATFIRNAPIQKYCSPECARIGLLEYQRNRKKEIVKNPIMKFKKSVRSQRRKVCVYCGKQFWVKKPQLRRALLIVKKKHQMLRKCQNELNAKLKKIK